MNGLNVKSVNFTKLLETTEGSQLKKIISNTIQQPNEYQLQLHNEKLKMNAASACISRYLKYQIQK